MGSVEGRKAVEEVRPEERMDFPEVSRMTDALRRGVLGRVLVVSMEEFVGWRGGCR